MADGKSFVTYRGQRMIEGWPEQIQAAQLVGHIALRDATLPRIPYGSEKEDWGADTRPCRDCAVVRGEFHVLNCDAEECPNCHEQLISCGCDFDESETFIP